MSIETLSNIITGLYGCDTDTKELEVYRVQAAVEIDGETFVVAKFPGDGRIEFLRGIEEGVMFPTPEAAQAYFRDDTQDDA